MFPCFEKRPRPWTLQPCAAGGITMATSPLNAVPVFFLSDPCAPTRIPRTEQNDPHFNYILYSGPASPIWRLFSKLSRRGCRGHGACGGEKGARSLWMPSVCVFCLDPVAPHGSQGLGQLTPFFIFAPLFQPLPCQLSPLSSNNLRPRTPAPCIRQGRTWARPL